MVHLYCYCCVHLNHRSCVSVFNWTMGVTYSLVSRVTMMRMGLLFMPPTQLELHIKLYRMVVNSVPTCGGRQQNGQRRVNVKVL